MREYNQEVCRPRHNWLVRTTVDHVILGHLSPGCRSLFLVNPIRLEPVVVRDETKLDLGVRELRDGPIDMHGE